MTLSFIYLQSNNNHREFFITFRTRIAKFTESLLSLSTMVQPFIKRGVIFKHKFYVVLPIYGILNQ